MYATGVRRAWGAGLLLVLVTAVFNIGVIAIDDYTFAIQSIIPAQIRTPQTIIEGAGFRSALPSLLLLPLTESALMLGIENPADQLRLVLLVIGLISFVMNSFFASKCFRLDYPAGDRRELIAVFLTGIFFAAPLFSTRPMIESLAAPFLTASAYFACAYGKKGRRRSLVAALTFLTIASLFRLQAGICLLALVAVIVVQKRWRDVGIFALVGSALFILSGLLDLAVKGSFHASLRSYLAYNIEHSSGFGVSPFYTFAILFVAVSIPPTFISRYRGFAWRSEYLSLAPALFYFLTFVVGHSLIPHKEERFMIPVIPLFLVLLTPLANYLWDRPGERWRRRYFLAVNTLLLIICSFNVPQNNILGLADYLQRHPRIQTVLNAPGSIVLFPDAFIVRKLYSRDVIAEDALLAKSGACEVVFLARKDLVDKLPADLKKIAEFKPGFLEAVAVALNPKQNARRAALELYAPENCRL